VRSAIGNAHSGRLNVWWRYWNVELLVVLVIVLIIFGAGKLPEIGKGLGKESGISGAHQPGLMTLKGTIKENEKELEDKAKKT